MKDNLVLVRTERGGIAPAVSLDRTVFEFVKVWLARDLRDLASAPTKCVIAEFDAVQSEPIIRRSVKIGSPTMLTALTNLFRGRTGRRWVYWATSEGLRLIAVHGTPERAFSAQ